MTENTPTPDQPEILAEGATVYVTGDTMNLLHGFEPGTEVTVVDAGDYLEDGSYNVRGLTEDGDEDTFWVHAQDLDVERPEVAPDPIVAFLTTLLGADVVSAMGFEPVEVPAEEPAEEPVTFEKGDRVRIMPSAFYVDQRAIGQIGTLTGEQYPNDLGALYVEGLEGVAALAGPGLQVVLPADLEKVSDVVAEAVEESVPASPLGLEVEKTGGTPDGSECFLGVPGCACARPEIEGRR